MRSNYATTQGAVLCVASFLYHDEHFVSNVLEIFYEMNPQARIEGAYIFFDEVQDVPGWDVAVCRILDTEKVSLYITGSSSRMLSEDIATELRGRSVSYELLPYSLREHLRQHHAEPERGRSLNSKVLMSSIKTSAVLSH